MTDNSTEFAALRALLESSFAARAAQDLDVIYQVRLGDSAPYHMVVQHGQLTIEHGEHPSPHLTLIFDSVATHMEVLSGGCDPMQAFLEGRMRADGHIVLAMRMLQLFVPQYASTGPEQLR